MSSYNRINNSYGVQNSKTQNGLLKTELGFQGFVLSDWYAQHTGIASANAGLDMVMPSALYWGSNQLATAVKNGSINATRLDDMATRILASWYRFAEFDTPGVTANNDVDARDPAAEQIIFQSAVEGHVLVKNVKSALPLEKLQTLSIFGYDAVNGQNYSAAEPTLYPYALENTRQYTDGSSFGDLNFLLFFASVQASGSMPEVAFNGSMIVGGGSGAILPTASISVYDALLQQAAVDNTTLYIDFVNQDPIVQTSDACLVVINAQSSESSDRSTLADVWSDTLVTNVANKCSNTIVVIHNAGIRLVDRFVDHENVTAIIYAHLPGQDSGNSLTEILYGRQSPSGRLPYTVAKNESDYGTLLEPTRPDDQDPQYSQSNFDEGVFIDYRHFIKNDITPRYPFGYGLTYTEFSYSNIEVSLNPTTNRDLAPPDAKVNAIAPEGGLASLYDIIANVTITVTNIGDFAAAEVAQLYIEIPNSSVPKALRGFEKHWIQPGESTSYTFLLRRRDLSMWDVVQQQWMMQYGEYKVYAGKSVLDIQLDSTFCL
nr:putative beta-glucosidase m [Quercus suber]